MIVVSTYLYRNGPFKNVERSLNQHKFWHAGIKWKRSDFLSWFRHIISSRNGKSTRIKNFKTISTSNIRVSTPLSIAHYNLELSIRGELLGDGSFHPGNICAPRLPSSAICTCSTYICTYNMYMWAWFLLLLHNQHVYLCVPGKARFSSHVRLIGALLISSSAYVLLWNMSTNRMQTYSTESTQRTNWDNIGTFVCNWMKLSSCARSVAAFWFTLKHERV